MNTLALDKAVANISLQRLLVTLAAAEFRR